MKFAIITHVAHKYQNDAYYAYEPYVREMNLWLKNVTETAVLAPISEDEITAIDSNYTTKLRFIKSPPFNLLGVQNKIISIFKIPYIIVQLVRVFLWTDHIHLRCPGNMGLLGCLVQIFFPSKPKTVKYAGNWDPKSKQPLSYRFQKWILSNTFLTRNCKVLVYGEWENQTKNIVPFFTATYRSADIEDVPERNLTKAIKVLFVGAFTKSKQPMLSVKSVQKLKEEGYNISLHMYGEGEEYEQVKKYIADFQLTDTVFLYGNQSKEVVKKAFQESHFLLFVSKSEGWPKVVAEAMFWSCLPISSSVSCIPFMLDNGNRGTLIGDNSSDTIVRELKKYIENVDLYTQQVSNAKKWSQKYTLDLFDSEISKLLES